MDVGFLIIAVAVSLFLWLSRQTVPHDFAFLWKRTFRNRDRIYVLFPGSYLMPFSKCISFSGRYVKLPLAEQSVSHTRLFICPGLGYDLRVTYQIRFKWDGYPNQEYKGPLDPEATIFERIDQRLVDALALVKNVPHTEIGSIVEDHLAALVVDERFFTYVDGSNKESFFVTSCIAESMRAILPVPVHSKELLKARTA